MERPTSDERSAIGAGGHDRAHGGALSGHPYAALGLALGVSFVVMFALTYLGVYRRDDVFVNLNRFYMALAMVAPMAVIMLVVMSHMFRNRIANAAVVTTSVLVFVGAVWAIQAQWFVGDRQFLRSMIPHHSIAIKTCERASLSDPEAKELCLQIIESQEREIDQMRAMLARLDD